MNRVHLNVTPYKCNHCEKAFFTDAYLKVHMKKNHKEETNKIFFGINVRDRTNCGLVFNIFMFE